MCLYIKRFKTIKQPPWEALWDFFFVKVIASMCLYKVYFYCHWLDVFKGNYGIKRDRTVSGRGNNEEGNVISCC